MVRLRCRHDAADGVFGLHRQRATVSRHAGGALELATGNGYRSGGGCSEISRHAGNHPQPGKGDAGNPRDPATRGAASPRGSETMVPWTGVKEGEKKGAVPPRPNHVVVVILENEHRASVMGSRHAPYLNKLAARGANLTQSYGDPTMQGVELAIYVRNKVVHPPNNIRSVEWPSGSELFEAWQFTSWCLELGILRQRATDG